MKKRQCNVIFSKKHSILSIQIKKNPWRVNSSAAVRVDIPIPIADDKITHHKTFKANIPGNDTWNRSQLSGKLNQIGKQQK